MDIRQVTETIAMIEEQHFDIRTITMGISLLDCIDPDIERAAEKILNYPEYFIYGAGEGNYERYYPEPVNEIHSSFVNLFFSYGIIPFTILMAWFKKRLKGLNVVSWICFISILVETTFLVNYRQALFWVAWITLFYLNEDQTNVESISNH